MIVSCGARYGAHHGVSYGAGLGVRYGARYGVRHGALDEVGEGRQVWYVRYGVLGKGEMRDVFLGD